MRQTLLATGALLGFQVNPALQQPEEGFLDE